MEMGYTNQILPQPGKYPGNHSNRFVFLLNFCLPSPFIVVNTTIWVHIWPPIRIPFFCGSDCLGYLHRFWSFNAISHLFELVATNGVKNAMATIITFLGVLKV